VLRFWRNRSLGTNLFSLGRSHYSLLRRKRTGVPIALVLRWNVLMLGVIFSPSGRV
jgi:hypothetical protein